MKKKLLVKYFTFASAASDGVSVVSFTMFFFLISQKKKVITKKKNKLIKIALLPRIKLNSTENTLSKALKDIKINQEEFKLISNKTEKSL